MNAQTLVSRYEELKGRVEKACLSCGRNPDSVRIIVVTKTHPLETVQAVIDAGIRDIGENRVQEIQEKAPFLRGEYEMHLIGHLQTNKVNKAVPLVQWIQSIDSIRLAEKVENAAAGAQKKIKILVQVNTSHEAAKSGCSESECISIAERVAQCRFLEFRGLMTIGPLDASEAGTRNSFSALRRLSEQCGRLAPAAGIELSMGMSSDFEWAISEGATMIRVGNLLLGQRDKVP
jgi:pyridoxal phosphate enzyme (YggS family)